MAEWFVKAIRFADVRPGDVVGEKAGEAYEISEVRGPRDKTYPTVHLFIKGGDHANLQGHPDQFIGLIHRPQPEWETAQDRLNRLVYRARLVAEARKECDILQLREALDAHELGKPQNPTQMQEAEEPIPGEYHGLGHV